MVSVLLLAYCLILSFIAAGYGSGYLFVYRKASEQSRVLPSEKSCRKVDVVVPVKDEDCLLAAKLQALACQSYPPSLLNIVVVDSSYDEACENVVKEFSSEHPGLSIVLVKDQDRLGKAHALNKAFAQCAGEICVITDVDVRFGESAISDLVSNFDDSQIGAVSGMEVLEDDTFEDSRVYRGFYNALRIAESNIDSSLMCESELAAYRRDLLTSLPDGTQCDDLSLTSSVRAQGYRAIYDARVLFFESEGRDRTTMMLQKIRRARGNAHELLRHAHLVFSKRLGDFSRIILPFEVFLNIVAPILIVSAVVTYILLLLHPATAILSTAILCLSIVSLPAAAILCTWSSSDNDATSRLKAGVSFLLAFIEFNMILFLALVLLAIRGPQTNWAPIARKDDS